METLTEMKDDVITPFLREEAKYLHSRIFESSPYLTRTLGLACLLLMLMRMTMILTNLLGNEKNTFSDLKRKRKGYN